jgi:glycosyltransferase involved in cell wall biosynthesis
MKLSICMPTYNRRAQLLTQLRRLRGLSAIGDVAKHVEIVVFDDSEKPLSKEELAEFSGIHFKYLSSRLLGERKLSLDQAMTRLLREANGTYVQFLSDDDLLYDSFLQSILGCIDDFPGVGVILSNAMHERKGPIIAETLKRPAKCNLGKILLRVQRLIGFCSSFCVNRERAIEFVDIAEARHFGFSFAWLHFVMPLIVQDRHLAVIYQPQIHINELSNSEIRKKIQDANGFNPGFYVYCEQLPDILAEYREATGRLTLVLFNVINVTKYMNGMLIGYLGGWDDPRRSISSLFRRYYWYPPIYLYTTLFFMPKRILGILYKCERFIRRKKSTI